MSEQPDSQAAGTTMRRLKRSRTLHVSSLMATAGFTLAACDTPPQKPAEPEPLVYTSVAECKTANAVPDAQCDAAFTQAQTDATETAPRYTTRQDCEWAWGADQCRSYNSGSGSFFIPLVAGFVLGQALDGNRSYYRSRPLYRECDGRFADNSCRSTRYTGGYGSGYYYRDTDYRTGRTVARRDTSTEVARSKPTKVQSRTATVSRGGFGGGGRSYSG